jgi:hypothetical protein
MKEAWEKRAEQYINKFLKKWNGKCSICGKPVKKTDLFPNGMPDMVNGAVVGKYVEVHGHPTCVHNVDRIVVIPNRMRSLVMSK